MSSTGPSRSPALSDEVHIVFDQQRPETTAGGGTFIVEPITVEQLRQEREIAATAVTIANPYASPPRPAVALRRHTHADLNRLHAERRYYSDHVVRSRTNLAAVGTRMQKRKRDCS